MTTPSTAQIRQQLNLVFDDLELSAFCLDYFPKVYDRFSQGMRKDNKITLLVDYCRHQPTGFEMLLDHVCKEDSYAKQGKSGKTGHLQPLIDALEVYINSWPTTKNGVGSAKGTDDSHMTRTEAKVPETLGVTQPVVDQPASGLNHQINEEIDKLFEPLKKLIQKASTPEELERLVKNVAEIVSQEAIEKILPQAAQRWRQLVHRAEVPQAALELARRGEKLFEPFEPLGLAKALHQDVRHLETAQDVHFKFIGSRQAPRFPLELAQLGSSLQPLTELQSWLKLQNWAKQGLEGISKQLKQRLEERVNQVHQTLDQQQYATALELATREQNWLQEPLWQNRFQDFSQELAQLAQNISLMLETEDRWQKLRQELEGGIVVLGSPEIRQHISAIPGRPYPDSKIDLPLQGLEIAQSIAEQLREEAPKTSHIAFVLEKHFTTLRIETPTGLDSQWAWLATCLEKLRSELEGQVSKLMTMLAAALKEESTNLPRRRDLAPRRLLELYWQARWLLAAEPALEVTQTLTLSLRETNDVLPALLKRLEEQQMADFLEYKVDGKQMERFMTYLLDWHRGSQTLPDEVSLPPWRGADNYQPSLPSESLLTELVTRLRELIKIYQDGPTTSQQMDLQLDKMLDSLAAIENLFQKLQRAGAF